jgi:hypothetical protein
MIAATERAPGSSVLGFWLVTAVGAVGLVVLYLVDPTAARWFPVCPFHELTGLHCPGCGTSRALHALVHGDILTALSNNVLSTLFVPMLAWTWVSYGLQTTGRKPLPSIRWSPAALWTLLAVILVFWIARNLPFYPLTILAP